MRAPPLAVTAGEPAGIGPDLCVAIAEHSTRVDFPDFVVVGDAATLMQRATKLNSKIKITATSIENIAVTHPVKGEMQVLNMALPAPVECGIPRPENAQTLLNGLGVAVTGCQNGTFRGLVTAPIAKHVISDAGISFMGHTEYLAALTGVTLPVMLLVSGDMRVALATTHMPLRDVPMNLTQDRLRSVLQVLHDDLRRRFAIEAPEIVVCGLNPHAGEGGYLGHEDDEIIAPVINALQNKGMRVRGPVPADTAFTPAAGSRDAVLAMYHDQGLPVLKYAGFGNAVNVTLGLPIIRTSVDHGTAFDLAGSGKADAGSLIAAIELAATLSCRV